MDSWSNFSLFEILNTLHDGVILFQNGHAVAANTRADELLGRVSIGLPLLKLLGEADIDLLHDPSVPELCYHLSVDKRWLTLTLRHLDSAHSIVSLREDSSDPGKLPFPQDEDDLTWLRTVAARLALFAIAPERLPTDELTASLRKYADQLQKYVSNASIRTIANAAFETVDPVCCSFPALWQQIRQRSADLLKPIGVTLAELTVSPCSIGTLRGDPQHFLKLIYNTIDALIYHGKEHDPQADITISANCGIAADYTYLSLNYCAPTPFPSDLQALHACMQKNPTHFTEVYAANVKLVLAVIRTYGGMLLSRSSGSIHELRLFLPQSPIVLAEPVDLSDTQVYPETELADTLSHPRFSSRS